MQFMPNPRATVCTQRTTAKTIQEYPETLFLRMPVQLESLFGEICTGAANFVLFTLKHNTFGRCAKYSKLLEKS
jgi:hypothetical protein